MNIDWLYNYEYIITKINFYSKFHFLMKILYYENLEPYGNIWLLHNYISYRTLY